MKVPPNTKHLFQDSHPTASHLTLTSPHDKDWANLLVSEHALKCTFLLLGMHDELRFLGIIVSPLHSLFNPFGIQTVSPAQSTKYW